MTRGSTLIEMVVVIVIVGVLAGAIFLPLVSGVKLWDQVQHREDTFAKARYGMERLVREIEWIRDDQSVYVVRVDWDSGQAGNQPRFQFVSGLPGNPTRDIRLSGGSVYLDFGSTYWGGSGPREVVAENVSGFTLTYYDAAGKALNPETVPSQIVTTAAGTNRLRNTNIWRIRIQMTVTSGNQSLTLEEIVKPRSFLRSNK